ncbi:MAG TPA: methyl-accepting chemotaxis protein [Nitrospirae bacterium]|nr:methyl-accepting chemotaxis protein [Nitrospirota bacterium]
MGERPYRRRHYFINRHFQGRFILTFVALACTGGLIAVALFNYLAYRKLDALMYSIHIPAKNINELLSSDMIYANLFALLFVFIVLFVAVNRLVIRVSGPLYRIKKDLEEIASGNLAFNITLRGKDEFKDFAEEINTLVEGQRAVFTGIRNDIERIDHYTREIERHYPKADMVALKNKQMQSHINSLREKLRGFKL